MHESSGRRLKYTVAAIGLLMGLLGSVAGIAFASHQFSDVPDSQPHHDNINALVDSGCATGFDDGTYRPGDPVTRGQTARQIVQCSTRINEDDQTTSDPADGVDVVAEASMIAGGSNPNTGRILLLANGTMTGDELADCPCRLTLEVRNVNTNTITATQTEVITTTSDCIAGVTCGNIQTFDMIPAGNTTAGNSFQARARISTAGDNTGYQVTSKIVVIYIPFDGNPTD